MPGASYRKSFNTFGLNDIFKAVTASDNITHFHLFIYNRWGGLVFESKSITEGWNGQHNGQPAPFYYSLFRYNHLQIFKIFPILSSDLFIVQPNKRSCYVKFKTAHNEKRKPYALMYGSIILSSSILLS
ncbi:MAG: gliding motility-associated C-terminal domain-containing protein [Bacteroidales bacterium]